jgi:hypothetical protein
MLEARIPELSLSFPFGLGEIKVEITQQQKNAAWQLYVELATRVSSDPLEPGMGSAREALSSLHSLFGCVRGILKETGPLAAQGNGSMASIALDVLNKGIRPFLVKWHTRLSDYEAQEKIRLAREFGGNHTLPPDEGKWPDSEAFYAELEQKRAALSQYVVQLSKIAGTNI